MVICLPVSVFKAHETNLLKREAFFPFSTAHKLLESYITFKKVHPSIEISIPYHNVKVRRETFLES